MPSPARFNIHFKGGNNSKGDGAIVKVPDLKIFLSLTNKEPSESKNDKAVINVRNYSNFIYKIYDSFA